MAGVRAAEEFCSRDKTCSISLAEVWRCHTRLRKLVIVYSGSKKKPPIQMSGVRITL
jgi:hypothetical protein